MARTDAQVVARCGDSHRAGRFCGRKPAGAREEGREIGAVMQLEVAIGQRAACESERRGQQGETVAHLDVPQKKVVAESPSSAARSALNPACPEPERP